MKKLVIFSGGLDSTAMAIIANSNKLDDVSLMSFYYGQKATPELERAKKFANSHGMELILQDISSLKSIFGKTQLTDETTNIQSSYQESVVVPLRNALFLQIAMIYAYTNGYDEVLLGSHLDDCIEVNGEKLFPDCSPEFFGAFEKAMDFGTFKKDKKVKIITASLLGLHKTDLIKKAYEIDPDSLYKSWSCYNGADKQCGECDSCRNRKQAFLDAGVIDKTDYKK